MYIDAPVYRSHTRQIVSYLFVLVVLAVAFWAGLVWWQCLLLVVVAGVLLFWHREPALCALSAKEPNELWQIGVGDELWQGYLNRVELFDMGLSQVIKLEFYVSEPQPKPLSILLFRSMLDEADFVKLAILARLGGYQSSEP